MKNAAEYRNKTLIRCFVPVFLLPNRKKATFVIGMRGESTAQRCSDRIRQQTVGETGVIRPLKRATDK